MHSRSVDIIFVKQTRRIKEIHDERNGMQDTSTSLFICISLIRMDIYSKSLSQNQSWLRNKKIPNHIHVQVSYITFTTCIHVDCRGGAVGQIVRLACGRFGVRIPAATDLSRKTGSDSSTAKRSGTGVSVTGSRGGPLQTDAP